MLGLVYIFYRLSKFDEVDSAGNVVYYAKPWPKLTRR